ncbi:unnamed protein product [Calypogeia fissa]
MKKLQYLDLDGPVVIDGVEEESSFPFNLVLLKCVRQLDTFDLGLQDHLAVLHLSGVEVLPRSIGKLSALKVLKLAGVHSLPDELGNLSQLEYLKFSNCHFQSLPETFGNLSKLEYLTLISFWDLKILPETFGGLFNLKDLKLHWCYGLTSLPETFGDLSALNRLSLSRCDSMSALPRSFGNLSALEHLEIHYCNGLHFFPVSFGNLSALEPVELNVRQLQPLPRSIGKLFTLRHLQLTDTGTLLSEIPFGQLTQLEYLSIYAVHDFVQIKELPKSFGELMAVGHLVLDSLSIRSIPDFIKNMKSLHTIELRMLPYISELPAWLRDTGGAPLALSRKIFQVVNGCFSLTSESYEETLRHNSPWEQAWKLIRTIHIYVTEKVNKSNYDGALQDLCLANLEMLGPKSQRFVLQERGIVRRMMGDLSGALKDLTAALEVFHEADDGRQYLYDCWKHRGFVKFSLGDLDGARNDRAMALDLMPEYKVDEVLNRPSLGQKSVTYLNFKMK